MDSFLWHLCSYKKVDCLEKEKAIKAFERLKKNQYTIFYQFTNEAFLVQNAKNVKVNDLPYNRLDFESSDMYVMDWGKQLDLYYNA